MPSIFVLLRQVSWQACTFLQYWSNYHTSDLKSHDKNLCLLTRKKNFIRIKKTAANLLFFPFLKSFSLKHFMTHFLPGFVIIAKKHIVQMSSYPLFSFSSLSIPPSFSRFLHFLSSYLFLMSLNFHTSLSFLCPAFSCISLKTPMTVSAAIFMGTASQLGGLSDPRRKEHHLF